MGKIKRYRNVVERFLSGESGQRFFNIAYSLGAAVVILGALFKILHLSGGDLLLSVGMGTEVLMFVLTAFDNPQREASMPMIAGGIVGGDFAGHADENSEPAATTATSGNIPSGNNSGGVVIIGGGGGGAVAAGNTGNTGNAGNAAVGSVAAAAPVGGVASAVPAGVSVGAGFAAPGVYPQPAPLEGTEEMAAGVKQLGESIEEYVKKMEDLNRSIAGLNAMYEMQLRSASSQMDTADSVSRGMRQMREIYEATAQRSAEYGEEARMLTEHIRSLNRVYARMLEAMTHNPLAQGAMAAEPERN